MAKFDKDFFIGNEVLFMGYSSKNQEFCRRIYKAFSDNGIKVYPVNSKENASYDIKVYKNIGELPNVPKTAYVLLSRGNAQKVIKELSDKGIKRILFQNKNVADQSVLDECGKLGIETIVACPMMKFGKGLHKVHAFFAGVR